LDEVVSSTGVTSPRAPTDDEPAPGCGVAASRVVELVADVAPFPGLETIVASYSAGLTIFDREDHIVAETPGYPCSGSSDELDAIAVGKTGGERVIVIAATSGGRNETSTWIGLFHARTLDALFAGVVEARVEDTITRGAIHLFATGLVHRHPNGTITLWGIDPGTGIYVPIMPELPHGEPELVSSR
jgi:hypothetical protein